MKITTLDIFKQRNGFALISTVLISSLLLLLGLGMLSLSSSVNRESTTESAIEEARANARMALIIAIGELQAQMGPDQRISANANILSLNSKGEEVSVANPNWTGVWDSWKAGPGEISHHSTLNETDQMSPAYNENRGDYFRGWLLSLNKDDIKTDPLVNVAQAMNLSLNGGLAPGANDTDVRLVGAGSVMGEARENYVSARLISIKDGNNSSKFSGRYGWWIGDESQKASLLLDTYVGESLTSADKIFRVQAPASMGNKLVPGLEKMKDEAEFSKVSSRRSLDLVSLIDEDSNGSGDTDSDKDLTSTLNFHSGTTYSYGVIADVREGGLKRDLNTILEQPIRREDEGDEFMLYSFSDSRFSDRKNSRVPIQDLSAYYQLYDNDPLFTKKRRGGVNYDSSHLADSIQLRVPDFDGGNKDRQKILNEYTTLYTQPVITKVQFLLGMAAEPITSADRQAVVDYIARRPSRSKAEPIRSTDTHKLKLGMTVMVTLWNPNNVPLVMDRSQIMRFSQPPFRFSWRKTSSNGKEYNSPAMSLSLAAVGRASYLGGGSGFGLLKLRFVNSLEPKIIFQAGEVKAFSIPSDVGANLLDDGTPITFSHEGANLDVTSEWDPGAFSLLAHSAPFGIWDNQSPDVVLIPKGPPDESVLVFNEQDSISFNIIPDDPALSTSRTVDRNAGPSSEIRNAGFNLYMLDEGYQSNWRDAIDFLRHYHMLSRHGGVTDAASAAFNRDLITPAFPGTQTSIKYGTPYPCSQLVSGSINGEIKTVLEFSLSLGCETRDMGSESFAGGRRITSRPFLHSSISGAPFIDKIDKASLYNYGWDWRLGDINTLEDSIVTAKPITNNGYYGGGYTIDQGSTHVIQREIPVLPIISMASLSNAQVGGYSLAYSNPMGEDPDNDKYWWKIGRMKAPIGNDYQRTTATGQAGLAPRVMQAIGNSYAHPHVPSGKAFTRKKRHFDQDEGEVDVPFVDHSYLANKALWDEFFFSSIAPQPESVPLYEDSGRSAGEVAKDFFFGGEPLPNRRIIPYGSALTTGGLEGLLASTNDYKDGFADQIASYLMVNGSFNVNSTSVDAWKVLLSSMKGKPVAYLEGGSKPKEFTPDGSVFGPGILPAASPVKTEEIAGPNLPPEQWKAARELTDGEINELAQSMVKQVKIRGPFLSMSEFVNRRLDPEREDLSVKGALQAALDDESVSINKNFREENRMLDVETKNIAGFEFAKAATGPIAYGSTPYVDQADVLRHLSEQLTPRADTFIIRVYGDSIDQKGNVAARVWCEAVVQRTPDYVDSNSVTGDLAYKKYAELKSLVNKSYGREFKLISFRWLNANEV